VVAASVGAARRRGNPRGISTWLAERSAQSCIASRWAWACLDLQSEVCCTHPLNPPIGSESTVTHLRTSR
jgi:hypothetical protein